MTTPKLDRYEMEVGTMSNIGGLVVRAVVTANGPWVRYEDHIALLALAATLPQDKVTLEEKYQLLMEKYIEAEKELLAAKDATLPDKVPEGWKLVPIKLTEAMIEAFGNHFFSADWREAERGCRNEAEDGWAVLLAAAPSGKGEG